MRFKPYEVFETQSAAPTENAAPPPPPPPPPSLRHWALQRQVIFLSNSTFYVYKCQCRKGLRCRMYDDCHWCIKANNKLNDLVILRYSTVDVLVYKAIGKRRIIVNIKVILISKVSNN